MAYLRRSEMLSYTQRALTYNKDCFVIMEKLREVTSLKPESDIWNDIKAIETKLEEQKTKLTIEEKATRSNIAMQSKKALSLCIQMKRITDKLIRMLNPSANHTPIFFSNTEDCLRGVHSLLINQELQLLKIWENSGEFYR